MTGDQARQFGNIRERDIVKGDETLLAWVKTCRGCDMYIQAFVEKFQTS